MLGFTVRLSRILAIFDKNVDFKNIYTQNRTASFRVRGVVRSTFLVKILCATICVNYRNRWHSEARGPSQERTREALYRVIVEGGEDTNCEASAGCRRAGRIAIAGQGNLKEDNESVSLKE